MKSLVLIVLALSASTSFATSPTKPAADRLQGHYSNPTYVIDYDATTAKSCAAKKGKWDGDECYSPSENTVSVYKVAGSKDQYFVTINIVSSRMNLCDVAEKFTRVGNSLIHIAEDKTSLLLSRLDNKMVVKDINDFSQLNCGHNAGVGGEYTRRRAAGEVDENDIADIKHCGFKGCLN